jgi:hypothetical protein
MRLLMSSLISDGLIVVAIAWFLGSYAARATHEERCFLLKVQARMPALVFAIVDDRWN